GRGGIVVVEGEPGIGKSRLLAYLAASATAPEFTVLAARASEYEGDLPVALPTVADHGHAPAQLDRHRTHRALRDLLERLAATRPLVVCLDDVHWADPASLDVLAALAHRAPSGPVLLAVA